MAEIQATAPLGLALKVRWNKKEKNETGRSHNKTVEKAKYRIQDIARRIQPRFEKSGF